MSTDEQKNGTLRTLLRSEITWAVLIAGGIMAFVTTTVLPIQALQLQTASVLQSIEENKMVYSEVIRRITNLEKETALINQKLQ